MKQITRDDGNITFTLPDSASDPADVEVHPRKRRRGVRRTGDEVSQELETILDALTEDEPVDEAAKAELVHGFSIDLGEGKPKRRRGGAKPVAPDEMLIDVTLEPEENAVVLIEQDGAYEWIFPDKTKLKRGRRRRGGPSIVEQKTAVFRIPIGEGTPPLKRRGATRAFGGKFTNFLTGKITGFVLRFVARKAIGALTRRLEQGVEPGPVIITSHDDTEGWQHKSDYLSVVLPSDRPSRILLLVHGTFSSTEGSFGALTEQPAGQRFLKLALEHYDAVLGYDHYTLADSPARNAEDIFERLYELQLRSQGIEIDAISFSRGGLVYRYLSEHIVPSEKTQLAFRKSIFIGCTNAGTELANDENWKDLIDFYTTMVAGASRILSLNPATKIAGMILHQGVKIIGSLAKYMAQDAVAGNSVPGLSAMEPDGPFVTSLNAPPASRTRPGARDYYAIGSDFEPDESTSAGELGKRMVLKIADGVVDRLMGEQNDLVVNTDSMFFVDPVPSARLIESLPFGENGSIYHTVYFLQPQVARTCTAWLGLVQAQTAVSGNAPRSWWPSVVSDDFMQMSALTSVANAKHRLEVNPSRFVVIAREHGGDVLHYGISRDELYQVINTSPDNQSLLASLNYNESDATGITMHAALDASSADDFRNATNFPNRGHAVIVGESGPVGVAASPEILSPEEMAMASPPHQANGGGGRKKAKKKARRKKRGTRAIEAALPRATASGADEETAAPPPESIWCYAHAVMPEEAVVDKKVTVDVTLSRDEIIRASGISGKGKVVADKDLIVQIQARKHCEISGESRVEVPVPAEGAETELYFDVIPRFEGVGEVRVIVRQGNQPIANLKLYPRFVTVASDGIVGMAEASAGLQPADSRRDPPNVLYIREGEMGQSRILDFEFESATLKKRVRDRSKPFQNATARQDYIENLYKTLEEFWADDDQEYESFMRRMRARGAELFDDLIPRQLQQLLWDERKKLNTIQVFSDEPFIPWELVYMKEPGKAATQDSFFLAEKGLVRGYSEPEEATPMAPTHLRLRAGKACYVIPSYPRGSNNELPGAQVEKDMLETVLDAKPIKANSDDVITALSKPGTFDILHFACHGIADSNSIWDAGLMMQGKMKSGKYKGDDLMSTDVKAFTNLIEDDSPGPLVFLNACQTGRRGYSLTGTSGFAKAFLKNGAGAFVSSHWSIGDLSALQFSKTFYEQLLDGKNMMTAVAAARKAAKNKEEPTWLSYVVYADPYAKLKKE